MGDRGAVAEARKAALQAGREFRDRLCAYENVAAAQQDSATADRQIAQDLKEEVVDILERFVAQQEREGHRR